MAPQWVTEPNLGPLVAGGKATILTLDEVPMVERNQMASTLALRGCQACARRTRLFKARCHHDRSCSAHGGNDEKSGKT